MRVASHTPALRRLLLAVALFFLVAGCGKEKSAPVQESASEPFDMLESTAPKDTPGPGPGEEVHSSWPTYHGAASLDGWAGVELPDSLALRWQVEIGAAISNTPVAADDRIFVSDASGNLHAVDLTGEVLWSKSFAASPVEGQKPRQIVFDAPLAVFDATLVACSAAGTIYAVDVATGDTRWESPTDAPILGTPNMARVFTEDGLQQRLFVIDQSQGALAAMDFATGSHLWTSDGVSRCDGSAGVNGEMAVFGSCAGALHVFSTETGALLREIPIDDDSQVAGGVALVGDSVFAGCRSGKLVHANARTGAIVWVNTDCDDETFSTPAVHGDWVVFTANDGTMRAVDRNTGVQKWRVDLGGMPTSPIIAGDKVAVASRGTLYLFRLLDGKQLWSYHVSDEITSPAVAGGLLLAGTDDGSLAAFGPS